MNKIKYIGVILILIVIMVLGLFGTGLLDLEFSKWYQPKKENIRREVFENTQSYVHGKNQQLSKYYEEWHKAETLDDKEVVENLIQIQFAHFDETDLNNYQLKQFLIKVRGY